MVWHCCGHSTCHCGFYCALSATQGLCWRRDQRKSVWRVQGGVFQVTCSARRCRQLTAKSWLRNPVGWEEVRQLPWLSLSMSFLNRMNALVKQSLALMRMLMVWPKSPQMLLLLALQSAQRFLGYTLQLMLWNLRLSYKCLECLLWNHPAGRY